MPTRKQRRRQQKLKRHEYVWEDEHGNEIDPAELRREQSDGKREPTVRAAANGKAPARDARGRPVRQVHPPSWRRVFRRAAIFGPIMFVVLIVANQKASAASQVAVALVYTALLVPFMYLMDRLAYRTYLRRAAQRGGGQRSSPRAGAGGGARQAPDAGGLTRLSRLFRR
jgi:hypothetical protein